MRIVRSPSMLWIAALYALSGCAQLIGIDDLPDPPDDAAPGGGRPDADPAAPDARPMDASIDSPDAGAPADARGGCESWSPRPTHFDPCDLPAPSPALNLELAGTYVYDTDQGTLRDPAGNEIAHAGVELPVNPLVRAISVDGLLVGTISQLRVVGSKPLLVASWSEIAVDGIIDVSSSLSQNGAGANTGNCVPAGSGGQDFEGGGGGGGGGFGGNGGRGGGNNDAANGGTPGGVVAMPVTVRGGCAGARGGLGNAADGSGAGGAGGGALQLTARNSIAITGRLHAGGSGGGGANGLVGRSDGGGGGGSGGLLDLEAPVVTFGPGAVVAANGGGGGEGTEREGANSGRTGQIGNAPADGGSGSSVTGGDGGDGSAGANLTGQNGSDGNQQGSERGGGGGGGGGAGYIIISGVQSVAGGAVLSPSPTTR